MLKTNLSATRSTLGNALRSAANEPNPVLLTMAYQTANGGPATACRASNSLIRLREMTCMPAHSISQYEILSLASPRRRNGRRRGLQRPVQEAGAGVGLEPTTFGAVVRACPSASL